MMKYLFVLLLLCSSILNINGQNYKIGLVGNYGLNRTEDYFSPWHNVFNFGMPIRKEFDKKWAIESGLYYNNYSITEYYNTECAPRPILYNVIPNMRLDYNFQNIQAPFWVDYNLGKGNRKLSVGIIGGLSFSAYLTANRKITEKCQGNITYSYATGLQLVNPFKVSLLVGTNLNYKLNEKYALRLSYIKKNYFTSTTRYKGNASVEMHTLGIGILYKLSKKPVRESTN